MAAPGQLGISGRIAAYFQHSPLTPLLTLAAALIGVFALIVTPREEEPQVNVTLATVTIPFPGATARQVEQMVTIPAEQLLSQIADVEHIMSASRPGVAMVTLQFEVGLPRTEALVRLHDVIQSNRDLLPAGFGIGEPVVKSKGIDDVPILTLALYSRQPHIGAFELERVAHALEIELKQIHGTREVATIGGPGQRIGLELDSARMRQAGITVAELRRALQDANFALPAGDLVGGNRRIVVEGGNLVGEAAALADIVVGTHDGKPILLADVASIDTDPPPEHYVWHTARSGDATQDFPAVTMTISKKPGMDASLIAFEVQRRLEGLRGTLIPPEVEVAVTRDFGAIGVDKALRLIHKLLFATVAVVMLVWLLLSWREAFLVAVAMVLTLLLMLFACWAIGYTLNRVSLFSLIFAVGILVDDAIVIAENIHRHMALEPGKPLREIIPRAVDEVGGPTILATFTVIAALMPIVMVGGMMGGFCHPIGIVPSIGMIISLAVAFVVTPWMARWLLKPAAHGDTLAARAAPILRRLGKPFLTEPRGSRYRLMLFALAPLLIGVALLFPLADLVSVRAMPYDNRTELQVIVDLPPDAPVERTAALLRELGTYLARVPEIRDYQSYAGVPAPIDFGGLARQYYLREGGEFGAIHLNLVDKHARALSSHEIAARIRPELHRIAQRYHAMLRVAESPAGPPSLAVAVAEIYGPDEIERRRIADEVKAIFAASPEVSDIIDSDTPPAARRTVLIDRRKAGALGVSQRDIVTTLRAGLGGEDAAYLHDATKYPIPLRLQLPPEDRVSLDQLLRLTVRAADGTPVPLSELVSVREDQREQAIQHKDLKPVIYIGGESTGAHDSPVYTILSSWDAIGAITTPNGTPVGQRLFFDPDDTQSRFSVRWEGEWRHTYETFRDLGLAFAVALILIYLLIVAHFGSYGIPLIIMIPIPLTLIGVIPGHWLLGAQISSTSAIGVLALAGIIVRNAILLVDFIRIETAKGKPLREAVVDAPLVRAQPILLTAIAAILSGAFIMGDNTFDGLGTTLMFGVLASTLLTLVLTPLLYYHFYREKEE